MFNSFKKYFNFKMIFGAIFFAVFVFVILLGILWSARAKTIAQVPATALLNIIEAPTQTPFAPAITLTPTLDPFSTPEAQTPVNEIKIGDYVQVNGTGGEGLRLHATAGVASEVDNVAMDAELLIVKDGPIDADGYFWWLLQDPYTENVVGWGVANYLTVVQNP
jgi:hypothetical protein